MSASEIIAHKLNNNAALTAVVPKEKQFLDFVTQQTPPPYIVVTDIGGNDGLHLSGQDEYPRERVQIDCVTDAEAGASASRNLCRLVNAALINTIKQTIVMGVGTSAIRYKDVDIYEAGRPYSVYEDSREVRVISQDYMVRYRRLT